MKYKLLECEYCGRNENEVMLLRYPYELVFKNVSYECGHVDEAYICLECIPKEIQECDELSIDNREE